jgi:glycosyltransferase 2 family protein
VIVKPSDTGSPPGLELSPREFRDGGRVRRPADLILAAMSFAVVAVVLGFIRTLPLGSTEVTDDVTGALLHVPRWLAFGAEVIAGVGCFVLAVAAVAVLARAEWRDARNAGAAALAGAGAAIAAWSVWQAEHATVYHAVINGRNPSIFVVDTAYIAFLVGADLARRSRWSRWCLSSVAALLLTGLAVTSLTPFGVVVGLFGGLMVGWAVRWLLGAASVRPSTDALARWLRGHRVPVTDLAPDAHRGRGRLTGVLRDGTPVDVHLADRDTRGAGLARRLWSLVRLRPVVAGHVSLSSRDRLQQLALAACLARDGGVPSPSVLYLGVTAGETLVLALARPRGRPLDEAMTPGVATALFRSLRALHDAGIAHRDLRPENLVVTGDGAGFSSLDAAVPAATELTRRLDLAQLLATLGGSLGPAKAIQALRAGYGPVDDASLAAVMQPVALAPWGWSAMRAAQPCLTEVRHELIGPGAAVPVARLERFRWRTIATSVALTVAAYLLVGQVSQVNLLGTLGRTNPAWFAVALLASAVTYLAAAQNLAAFVPRRLSPLRGFAVQLATAFVGVALPPTVGHVAVNARYLHRQDVDEGTIGAAVTLSQAVNVVVTVLLLVVLALLTGSGLSRFKIAPGSDLLIGAGAIAAVIALLLAIPATRAMLRNTVWPHLRSIWPTFLDSISHPWRLAASAGANLLLTAAYLVAFIASLHAVGAHPALLPAAVVYLAGNTVGSAAPTPGGIGGVEAVLAAGLTAMGVPAAEAIPGVLVFRFATFWLPIPAGWVSYVLLQRRGVL